MLFVTFKEWHAYCSKVVKVIQKILGDIMNLIPIVYTSLLIVTGLLVVVLTVSYIFSKLKRNDSKPYEYAPVTPNYGSPIQQNYKRAIILTDNRETFSRNDIGYKNNEPVKERYYREDNQANFSRSTGNSGYSSRFSRVHTNTYDFEDNSNFYNSYHRKKPIQYNESNLYKYYSEF